MSQPIELRALVGRDGKVWLVRPEGGSWVLPGGRFADDAEDVDAAMDSLLRDVGVASENIAEDFMRTAFLPGDGGEVLLNIYAPLTWLGEPRAPEGHEAGWFALDEFEALGMEPALRGVVMSVYGMAEDEEEDEFELEGFFTSMEENLLAELAGARPGAAPPVDPANAGSAALPAGDRRAAGLDVMRTLGGGSDPVAGALAMEGRMPEIAGDVIDFALGEVWSHPALDRKTRSLQVVAMLAALGGRAGPLRSHINGALNHGATPEQVTQTLRMVAVYAGFPVALEAWPVMEEVFAARGIARPGRPA